MKVVSKQHFRIQWRPQKPFNYLCSVYVTNQDYPFSFLVPSHFSPPQTHTQLIHTDCHLGAWITSLGDYLAQIKKLTVLSLFRVSFYKQNLRKLTLYLGLAAFARDQPPGEP